MPRAIVRWRRWVPAVSVVVLACASAVPAVRTPILRAAGWALVAEDPVGPAEIIVVASDAGGAGVLEAVDLLHSGIATRVAVFTDPPGALVDREFIRRGAPYADAAARSIGQFRSLGITTIEQIPRSVAGHEDEGRVLPAWCDLHQFRSVVLVTNSDRSRRLRRVLHRAMAGHRTQVMVRFTRYTQFDPNRWWQTRAGIRTEIIELQRLLLDLARHPISS
jgi:hypothetical protein